MGWRETLLGQETRQLKEQDIPRSMRIVIGPDSPASSYPNNHTYFMTSYDLKFKPSVGVAAACNGQVETYNLPFMPELLCEFDAYDYDLAFEEKLRTWFVARTALRLWAWGQWIGRGYLAGSPITRPAPITMKVPILFTGIRVFNSNAGVVWPGHPEYTQVKSYDGTTDVQMLDVPFAMDSGSVTIFNNYTTLFGQEIWP